MPRLHAVLDLAASCLTGIGKSELLKGVQSHIDGGKRGVARFGEVIPLCLEIVNTPDHDTPSRLLTALQARTDTRIYRREMFYAMRSALQLMTTGQYESLTDAVWEVQNRIRHAGRKIGYRNIGSTLLIKGLEFDHAVIVDADSLTRKNLYVAITRPSRTITLLSRSEQLTPAD